MVGLAHPNGRDASHAGFGCLRGSPSELREALSVLLRCESSSVSVWTSERARHADVWMMRIITGHYTREHSRTTRKVLRGLQVTC